MQLQLLNSVILYILIFILYNVQIDLTSFFLYISITDVTYKYF